MDNLYWVGPRQSDIEGIGNLFKGSITIFGDNSQGNISYCTKNKRINHNVRNSECDVFFIQTLTDICRNDTDARFIFYNPIKAYEYGETILHRTLCLNPYNILSTLSDKKLARHMLRDVVEIIPYVSIKGVECSFQNISKYFTNDCEFIVQEAISSGGEGTFHIDAGSHVVFDEQKEYIVSPYITNAISLNAHILISEEIICFPPSVQIITERNGKLLYSGADYICYSMLNLDAQKLVAQKLNSIGAFVKRKGYRGVLGIDLMLKDEHIYFVEFNARYQASSQLLNRALFESQCTSLQELNLNIFSGATKSIITPFSIPYSNYVYSSSNITTNRFKRIALSSEVLQIQTDGFDPNGPYPDESDIYLARFIFDQNICAVSRGKVVLHPNIFCEDIKSILHRDNPHFREYTKIALLNHGITMTNAAVNVASRNGQIKEAVFDAIDAVVFGNVYINIPCSCKFNSFSPFYIDSLNDCLYIYMDGTVISDVSIECVQNALKDKYTNSGVPYDAIINLATDRIRINPAPVCYYKLKKASCKFCNLPESNHSYSLSDIKEVIDYCLKSVKFRHFLIGGGTYGVDQKSWHIVGEIAKYIRQQSTKNIYIMTIPPRRKDELDYLKECGISEVAFNLEIFDRTLAKQYMPGKGNIPFEQYMMALSHAVELWGRTGSVRSLLIYGFDEDSVFLEGIESLCKMGIEPIISIFRPLKGTELYACNPPATLDIINIYHSCQSIVSRYAMILGPDCPMCQNNTLSYTEVIHAD